MPPAPLPPAAQTVTASELVRHFGEWQRRAAQSPVYILHHRRPQFVLASVELMQALSNRGREPDPADMTRLLDALFEPVLIVDRTGMVTAAGHPARLCFGAAAGPGARLDDILSAAAAAHLTTLVARAADRRLREQAELPLADGRLQLNIEPYPGGALITARAVGDADALDAAVAENEALLAALAVLPGVAVAGLDSAGRLQSPCGGLADLTGVPETALRDRPLAELFAPDAQPAVVAGVEAASAGSASRFDATLLASGRSRLVTVALAPRRRIATLDGLTGVFVERGS